MCIALLPLLLVLFYSVNAVPAEERTERRIHTFAVALALAALGVFDPRFAVVADLLVWLVLAIGYTMDKRRKSEMWGPPFKAWTFATLGGLACYLPLWWWRRLHPGAVGGPLSVFPLTGADFLELGWPSEYYVGLVAAVLAVSALRLAMSYRDQARLWFILACVCVWMSFGPRFMLGGRYLWWVPALYRGARKIGMLADIDPSFFAAAGQFCLAILAGYGFAALLTRVPPRKVRWLRPLATAAIALLLIGDFLRFRPFLP